MALTRAWRSTNGIAHIQIHNLELFFCDEIRLILLRKPRALEGRQAFERSPPTAKSD